MSIAVLYEDEYCIAVDKPAGVIVHGDGTNRATLTDDVRAYLSDSGQVRAAHDLQALQRLDEDTTGVVLFSKDKERQSQFDALIASHERITKTYLALVRGSFPEDEQTISLSIGKDRHNAQRMCVSKTGKNACSHAKLLAESRAGGNRVSLVRVGIDTGRKHQIRVHLSALGYPIVGDGLYGTPADKAQAKRSDDKRLSLMLHAYKEEFIHPVSGERITICAPYPQRFNAFIEQPSYLV